MVTVVKKIVSTCEVEMLDKLVCISTSTNTFEKTVNPFLLSQVIVEIVDQSDLLCLCKATGLGVDKYFL